VIQIKDETLASNKFDDRRVLEHLLSYLEYQFGDKVPGIDYRERGDGERIINWDIDIVILNDIISMLAELHGLDNSLNVIARDEKALFYLQQSLCLLNPWLIQLNLDASNRIDSRNDHQMNQLLQQLFYTENNMSVVTSNDMAEGHCQRALAYSKRFGLEGEEKITMMFKALCSYSTLRQHQGNLSLALSFAEEAYNLVVEAYDPVHFQVQVAAGILIDILIRKGNLFDAEVSNYTSIYLRMYVYKHIYIFLEMNMHILTAFC
jgi:hypothetical protein